MRAVWGRVFLCAGLMLAGPALARPVVAIIDSGVARTAELGSNVVAEHDLASPAPRAAFRPRYDHGTMVATILNRAAGGQIDIVSLRIDDPGGCPAKGVPPCQPSAAPIVAAIRLATALKVEAINISLSLKEDDAITAAIAEATHQGVTVVLAAGNQGSDHPGNLAMARAGWPRAVLVGARDDKGDVWQGTNKPDASGGYDYVWAPGVMVPTQNAEGVTVFATGTSFAAPAETARRVLGERPGTSVATAARAAP